MWIRYLGDDVKGGCLYLLALWHVIFTCWSSEDMNKTEIQAGTFYALLVFDKSFDPSVDFPR